MAGAPHRQLGVGILPALGDILSFVASKKVRSGPPRHGLCMRPSTASTATLPPLGLRSSLVRLSVGLVFSAAAVAACGDDGNVLGSDGSSGTAGAMSAGGASAGAGRGGSAATA